MSSRRLRVLTIASHPIPYGVPVFRLMAQDPALDYEVAFCSLRGAEAAHDPEFGRSVQWDVPMLDGYHWTHVPNRGSGRESFLGLFNPDLWSFIRRGRFDAVICHLSYLRISFWIANFAARSIDCAFIFGTDASSIEPRDGRKWKVTVKKLIWPALFRFASQVLTASTAGRDMMKSLGLDDDHISMTLDTVDNEWWIAEAEKANRDAIRKSWGVNAEEKVILFCAKLQPWKRPLDLLRAFAQANIPEATLVFAGDGPLQSAIDSESAALGISKRVRSLGFVNQSRLPEVYRASDVMVIPSEYEPFGLVVNEAMLCGCVVLASSNVGAVGDLISEGQTGFVYPCGDVRALSNLLRQTLGNAELLQDVGRAARERIAAWSPRASAAALAEAVVRAVYRSGKITTGNQTAINSPIPKQSLPNTRQP